MKDSAISFHQQVGREKSHSLTNNDTNTSRDFFNENDENMRNDDNGDLIKFLIDEESDEDNSQQKSKSNLRIKSELISHK